MSVPSHLRFASCFAGGSRGQGIWARPAVFVGTGQEPRKPHFPTFDNVHALALC